MSTSEGSYYWNLSAVQPQTVAFTRAGETNRRAYRLWMDNNWHSLKPTERQVQLLQTNANLDLYTSSDYSFVIWFKPFIVQQGTFVGETDIVDTMGKMNNIAFDPDDPTPDDAYNDMFKNPRYFGRSIGYLIGANSNTSIFQLGDLPDWNEPMIEVAQGLFPANGVTQTNKIINGVNTTVYNFLSPGAFPNVSEGEFNSDNLFKLADVQYVETQPSVFTPVSVGVNWKLLDPYTDPTKNNAFSYMNVGEPFIVLHKQTSSGVNQYMDSGYYMCVGVQYSPTPVEGVSL